MSQRENERASRSLGGKPAAVWECSPYISLSPLLLLSLSLSLFPVHLHCCETELNKVKEKVKQADRRSSLPTCHSSRMGSCSSMKGSKTQIVCRDADWGKTRLAQPDSTRLLSPSLEERVIFCSLLFPITPPTSHSAVLHLLFFVFPASQFPRFSFVIYSQLVNLAFACYLSHFGTSVLSSSTSPPLYHSASVYPFFLHVDPVKVISVLETGGWCSYIQLLLWITGRGWMDGW